MRYFMYRWMSTVVKLHSSRCVIFITVQSDLIARFYQEKNKSSFFLKALFLQKSLSNFCKHIINGAPWSHEHLLVNLIYWSWTWTKCEAQNDRCAGDNLHYNSITSLVKLAFNLYSSQNVKKFKLTKHANDMFTYYFFICVSLECTKTRYNIIPHRAFVTR